MGYYIDTKLPSDIQNIIYKEFKPFDSIHKAYCNELLSNRCIKEIMNIYNDSLNIKDISYFGVTLIYSECKINILLFDIGDFKEPLSSNGCLEYYKIINKKLKDKVNLFKLKELIETIKKKIPKQIKMQIIGDKIYGKGQPFLLQYKNSILMNDRYYNLYYDIEEYFFFLIGSPFICSIYMYSSTLKSVYESVTIDQIVESDYWS